MRNPQAVYCLLTPLQHPPGNVTLSNIVNVTSHSLLVNDPLLSARLWLLTSPLTLHRDELCDRFVPRVTLILPDLVNVLRLPIDYRIVGTLTDEVCLRLGVKVLNVAFRHHIEGLLYEPDQSMPVTIAPEDGAATHAA